MTILQTGIRSLTGQAAIRWAQAKAQQLSSNSFGQKLSEAYAKVPQRATTGARAVQVHTPTAAPARQDIAVVGRDSASVTSTATVTSATAAPASPFTNLAASSTAATTATASADPSAPSAPAVPSGPTDLLTAGVPAAAAALLNPETVNSTVAELLTQNAPPTPYASVGAGSTDPAVYRTDDYIKALNLNSFLQAANHDNTYRYQQYDFQLREWSEGGMQGSPPPPPKYETVDLNGFDTWWAQYNANIGQNAPSTTSFITNGPTDGGYGWTTS